MNPTDAYQSLVNRVKHIPRYMDVANMDRQTMANILQPIIMFYVNHNTGMIPKDIFFVQTVEQLSEDGHVTRDIGMHLLAKQMYAHPVNQMNPQMHVPFQVPHPTVPYNYPPSLAQQPRTPNYGTQPHMMYVNTHHVNMHQQMHQPQRIPPPQVHQLQAPIQHMHHQGQLQFNNWAPNQVGTMPNGFNRGAVPRFNTNTTNGVPGVAPFPPDPPNNMAVPGAINVPPPAASTHNPMWPRQGGRHNTHGNPPIPLVIGTGDGGSVTTVTAASSNATVRQQYEIWDDFPVIRGDQWHNIGEIVEDTLGPCSNPAKRGRSFLVRGGGKDNTKTFVCGCQFFVQAVRSHTNIVLKKRIGTDFPHDEVSSMVNDNPITDEPVLDDHLKELTSGILAENPKKQPLAVWKMIRQSHPDIPNTMESFYVIQAYVKYLRQVNVRNPENCIVTDFNSQISYVEEHSIWEHINLAQAGGCSTASSFEVFAGLLAISDYEKLMTIPLSATTRNVITGMGLDENMKLRCLGTILVVNAGSLWTLKMFLQLPAWLRITTLDFTLGMLSDGSSMGQVCAVGFQKDHRDKALQRQQSHPMLTSLAFETKCQVAVMYMSLKELSLKIFNVELEAKFQISDQSMAIRSGRLLVDGTTTLYACLTHHRNMPNNSPHWRKLIRRYRSFVQILHIFIERMVCHYRTTKVRDLVFSLFEASCRDIGGLNQVKFIDMFKRQYGPTTELWKVLTYFAVHITGVASENQGHESLYRKTKGSDVLGQAPIGHLNSSLNDCLLHTVPQLLCHDLSRVMQRKSLLLRGLQIGFDVGVPEMTMCKLALTSPQTDVRPISQAELLELCPHFHVAVGIETTTSTCYVCNSVATAGKEISDDRIKRMTSILFEPEVDLPHSTLLEYKGAGSYYEMAMQDLMFVFQASTQVNNHLIEKMSHNYLSLYCWTCYTFQRSCYCDHTINVAALQGSLPVSIDDLMTKIFARNSGRSHRRMNPTYTRARRVYIYDQFHKKLGMQLEVSKRLDYLADRSTDILRQLVGKMYRYPDISGYYQETNRISKTCLLDTVVVGTSLGNEIVGCQLAEGTTGRSDFVERHKTKKLQAYPFIQGVEEDTVNQDPDVYPPIFDLQNRGSCVGYDMVLDTYAFGNEDNNIWNQNYQIAMAFWFALKGDYKDETITWRLEDMEIIFEVQTMGISGHIAQIGTRIIDFDNGSLPVDGMLKNIDLQFRADTPLQACLNRAKLIKDMTEHDEIKDNLVSLLYVTPNNCHTIFRLITPANVFEYHLVNISEKKRMICQDVYALFRLLHRIYMFEVNSQETNRPRNRSLLFRIKGSERSLELTDNYMEGVGSPIQLPSFVDQFDEPDGELADNSGDEDDVDEDDVDEDGDLDDVDEDGDLGLDHHLGGYDSESDDDGNDDGNDDSDDDGNDDSDDDGNDDGNDDGVIIGHADAEEEKEEEKEEEEEDAIIAGADSTNIPRDEDGYVDSSNDENSNGGTEPMDETLQQETTGLQETSTPGQVDAAATAPTIGTLQIDHDTAVARVAANSTVIVLDNNEEVFEEVNEETRMEWEIMREQQRQKDREETIEAEKRLSELLRMHNGRRITRSQQDYCCLCDLSGDFTRADYINGWIHEKNTCLDNHPMCENCIHGLWKSPMAYPPGGVIRGRRIRFSNEIIKCPMCNQIAEYVNRHNGTPIQYREKSVIHGVIEWKNHFDDEDSMYQYIAGQGMKATWDVLQNMWSHDFSLRPRAQEELKRQLKYMFGNRTFNCNLCREDKRMMQRYAHTNGVHEKSHSCTFEVCKYCVVDTEKIEFKRRGTSETILFKCPSCEEARNALRPHCQDWEIWYAVKFMSTESDSRSLGPKALQINWDDDD
jgi:hypothetical protein